MSSRRAAEIAGQNRPVHRRGRGIHGYQWFAYVAVFPALAFLATLLLYPILYALYLSFTDADGVSSKFIGLDNYQDLLADPTFWRVLLNNLIFLAAVPLVVFASLICAVLIYEQTWGWRFFRVAFFVPSVISTVVVGTLFRGLFDYDGPVNRLLGLLHIAPVNFLGEANTAIMVIILALLWSSFGYGMLILLAGMSTIDPAIYEAARLDGAGWTRRMYHVTLPLIAPVLRFVSVLNVTYTFTSLFGFIFVMTAGGPGYSTTTVDYYIYLKGFANFDLGGAAAVAFLLFLIILVLTAAQFRVFRSRD